MREPFSFYTIYEFDDEDKFYKRNGFAISKQLENNV